jgi:cysteine dioxygenase
MQTQTTIALAELFDELDQYDHRVPLGLLEERLKSLQIDWEQIRSFVRFAPHAYCRNLMRTGPAYHALILCWRSGQRSPIHDHRGSSCGVRVLRGTCTETIFDRTDAGHIFPRQTRQLQAGHCCGSQDADIHQISNLATGDQDLITLHIYSPPLLLMGQYSLTSATRTEVAEQVHDEFVAGAGI